MDLAVHLGVTGHRRPLQNGHPARKRLVLEPALSSRKQSAVHATPTHEGRAV